MSRCGNTGPYGACERTEGHKGDHMRGGTPPVRSRWPNAASPVPRCSSVIESYYRCWRDEGHDTEHGDGMGRRWPVRP